MRTLILLLLLSPLVVAAEEIYRSTDEQGNPLFTDDPPSEDAEPIELDPVTTVPSSEPEPTAGQQAEEADGGDEPSGSERTAYRGISVTYPPAGQAVRHNGGLVPVRVSLSPEGVSLSEGHQIEVILDGEVRGKGASTQISVSAVSRGPHTVRARIVDADGRAIVSSDAVDFMLLRVSLGNE